MTEPIGSEAKDRSVMEHPRIDDERVVDRYLAGRLAAEDTARFEEHLFACNNCLSAVEAGEQLRRGLQAVAVENAARAQGLAALGVLAWLRRRPGLLAAVTLLAVVLPAALVWQQLELQRLRGAGGRPAFDRPMADLQLVPLGVVRDAGPALLEVDPDRPLILLSLELPPVGVPGATFRVELFSGGESADELVWRDDGLEPTLYGSLLVAVPGQLLAPGAYRIVVGPDAGEGTEDGVETDEQVIELRVVESPASR